jgi:hypothetical protein
MATKEIKDLTQKQLLDPNRDLVLSQFTDTGINHYSTVQDVADSLIAIWKSLPVIEFIAVQNNNAFDLTGVKGASVKEYYAGLRCGFWVTNTTTGAITINVSGLGGNKTLKKLIGDGVPLLTAGQYVDIVYTGDAQTGFFRYAKELQNFEIVNAIPDTVNNLATTDKLLTIQGGAIKSIALSDVDKTLSKEGITLFTTVQNGNNFTLTPVYSATVTEYKPGQRINFYTTQATNGNVKAQIGNLPLVDVFSWNTDTYVSLVANEYVEAIYLNGKFRRTNELNTNLVWSNDYTAAATVSQQGDRTTINLTSAIGAKKTVIYNGMTCTFKMPIDSAGAIDVYIDNIQAAKRLNDPQGDIINDGLWKNDIVMIRYDSVLGYFEKLRFSTEEPSVEDIAVQTNQPVQQVVQKIEQSGTTTVYVGQNETCKTITDAINQLVKSFGVTGGGKKCTIILRQGFILTEKVTIEKKDLSWITIKSDNNVAITAQITAQIYGGFFITNSISPIISANFFLTKTDANDPALFYVDYNSTLVIDSSTISINNNTTLLQVYGRAGYKTSAIIKNTAITNNGYRVVNMVGANSKEDGTNIFVTLENCQITASTTMAYLVSSYSGGSQGKSGNFKCINVSYVGQNSTDYRLFYTRGFFTTLYLENCTFNKRLHLGSNATIVNCRVNTTESLLQWDAGALLVDSNSANVKVAGGSYTNNNVSPYDIYNFDQKSPILFYQYNGNYPSGNIDPQNINTIRTLMGAWNG